MCGIAGKLWYLSGTSPAAASDLMERMAGRMNYRGPDAQGTWVDVHGRAGLAHRRLSIIDLDPRSNQPMQNEDGTVWLTFNGEIYNYQALREPLQASGRHTLRTTGDSEVLLHLYEELGRTDVAAYLNKLNGMFAFGLWDAHQQQLLLVRDHLGEKPLYYAETADGLVFGSTIKGLLEDAGLVRQVDPLAIQLYLVLGYIPAPLTAFEGIKKLPAGHYLIAGRNGIRRVSQYWAPDFEPKLRLPEQELQRLLLERLEAAIRLRMISDVPLGVFLSGGIDSSTVVAMMRRVSSQPIKTFSVGFVGWPQDETAQAQLVARYFGCDHTQLEVDLTPESLPELVRYYEEPFADGAAIPTFFMSKAARRHVTVALNGDGGDENFAGYTLRYRSYSWAEALGLPAPARWGALALAELLPEHESESSLLYRTRKSLRVLGEHEWRRNLALMEVFLPMGRAGMHNGSSTAGMFQPLERIWASACRFNGLDRELYFSLALHLPERLLVKADRASMAWALETRPPLLDRDLVAFCAQIPAEYKLRGKVGKYILKQALRGIVPDAILNRGKQGFIPPLHQWLRNELRGLVEEVLLSRDSFVAQQLSPALVRRIVQEHLDGSRDHQRRLYTLLNLELWERQFIRGHTF